MIKFLDKNARSVDILCLFVMLIGIITIINTFLYGNIHVTSILIISFLLLFFSMWCWYRKRSLGFLSSLLIVAVLIFVYTFSLEFFSEWKNIEADTYIQKLDNVTVYDFQSNIFYGDSYTVLNQILRISTDRLVEDTTSYTSFDLPKQTLWHNITMYGGTDNILIRNVSNKIDDNISTVIHPYVNIDKNHYYTIETYFWMPKMDPYGSVRIELRGYNGHTKTDMSLGLHLNSFSSECNFCVTSPIKNEVSNQVLYKYNTSTYLGQRVDRPSIFYSIVGKDTGIIVAYLRAQNKHALIVRQLMIGVIGGLIVALANRTLVDRNNHIRSVVYYLNIISTTKRKVVSKLGEYLKKVLQIKIFDSGC